MACAFHMTYLVAAYPSVLAVLRETLRLQPTAAIRVVYPLEDTVVGRGKYFVKAGQAIALQIWDSHRDPSVWSDDVRASLSLISVFDVDYVGRPKNFDPKECWMENSRRHR